MRSTEPLHARGADRSVERPCLKALLNGLTAKKAMDSSSPMMGQPDDGSKDVLVHISALEHAGLSGLGEGQQVSYEVERGQQG